MRAKLVFCALISSNFLLCQALLAESWHATAGAQSADQGVQVIAFLPTEMWIHAGDSITWSFLTDEPHSVTFLTPGQIRPSFSAGCPGITPDESTFDNSQCVNSGRVSIAGTFYTVKFPVPGNYRLACLVHVNMTALIHVLDLAQPLPHNQEFYDTQAAAEARALLTDRDGRDREEAAKQAHAEHAHAHNPMVITGSGEIVSNPGGVESVSVMRFMQPTITIHAGETVEWDSFDVSGHTITFGQEPDNPTPSTPPSSNVFADPDGARHAIINSESDNVYSGFIAQAGHERGGVAQAPAPIAQVQPPVGVTRFRVTFTHAGTYPYLCSFHDELGMKGEVVVLPQ
jgi:plastocyanin